MLKANVSFQTQSLAVRDCGSPLAEHNRDVSHGELGLVFGHGRRLPCMQCFSSQGSSFKAFIPGELPGTSNACVCPCACVLG